MQFDSRLRQGSFGSDRLSALARDADVDNDVEEPLLISALGLPHPDDDTDVDEYEGFVSPRLLGGSEYVQQNMYMVRFSCCRIEKACSDTLSFNLISTPNNKLNTE